jgi:hypothetical protein
MQKRVSYFGTIVVKLHLREVADAVAENLAVAPDDGYPSLKLNAGILSQTVN